MTQRPLLPALVLMATMAACSREPHQSEAAGSAPAARSAAPASVVAAPPVSSGLPPLKAEYPQVKLQLRGFGPATVAVPRGATTPRPVVIGVHGHGIRPEQACRNWMRVADGYPFVLCPHGLPKDAPDDAPVTLGTDDYTAREIEAGLAALRSLFRSHLAEVPLVYAGFSMGAKLGVEIVDQHPDQYSRVALGEGGYAELTQSLAARWHAAGLSRVLLVCSTRPCDMSYRPVQQRLKRGGIDVRVAGSGGDVHLFDGAVVDKAREQWPWLVEGAPGFTP